MLTLDGLDDYFVTPEGLPDCEVPPVPLMNSSEKFQFTQFYF